jgi:hypothetical protein
MQLCLYLRISTFELLQYCPRGTSVVSAKKMGSQPTEPETVQKCRKHTVRNDSPRTIVHSHEDLKFAFKRWKVANLEHD